MRKEVEGDTRYGRGSVCARMRKMSSGTEVDVDPIAILRSAYNHQPSVFAHQKRAYVRRQYDLSFARREAFDFECELVHFSKPFEPRIAFSES